MKVVIASDIHGSLKYTEKLDELISEVQPDKIILLGDLLYHGARNDLPDQYSTMGVCDILNKYSGIIVAVRGNCDSEVDNTVTKFDLNVDYKEFDFEGVQVILTHGHLNSWLIDIIGDKLVLCGHSHVYNLDGQYINPGSVGIPRVNQEHTCIVYENREFKLVNLDNFSIIAKRSI